MTKDDTPKPAPPPVCPECGCSATKEKGGHTVCEHCGHVYK